MFRLFARPRRAHRPRRHVYRQSDAARRRAGGQSRAFPGERGAAAALSGSLWGVVNATFGSTGKRFDDLTAEDFDRTNRLNLLAKLRDCMHLIADFSKVAG